MKTIMVCFLLLFVGADCFGQLVRKKDYDAAFAIQAGGEFGALLPWGERGVSLQPTGGLKITFPFTRKWFLGTEINYSELRYKSMGNIRAGARVEARFHMQQIQMPLYLKYMLNNNKACVLMGVYGAYVFSPDLKLSSMGGEATLGIAPPMPADDREVDLSNSLERWNAGITVGYEHRIVKHLNIMCRMSAGAREVLKDKSIWDKALFPIQATVTLSFDLLRIGDCGCD